MTWRNMGDDDADRRLRTILRAGDPAGGGAEPAPGRAARWRRAMLGAAGARREERSIPCWRLVAAALAGFGAVVVISAWILVRAPAPTTPGAGRPDAAHALRTIRMTGPGGTRIIWSVNPEPPAAPSRTQPPPTGDRS